MNERRHPTAEDIAYLGGYQKATTEGRKVQLAYHLDPVRASFGFLDNHGYYPPIHIEDADIRDGDVIYDKTMKEIFLIWDMEKCCT